MSEDRANGGERVPLTRPIPVRRLSRRQETPFAIEADAAERAALARFLGVDRVDRLSFEGTVAPAGEDGWEVRGRLEAVLGQTCVVTLEPVETRHDAELERLYLPAEQLIEAPEVTVDIDEADEPDPYTNAIDPAALAVESLALMIDPYPRREGVALEQGTFAGPGVRPLEDDDVRPFAGLAELKRRLEKGEE